MHNDIERVLLSEEEIRQGIDRVALEITESYRGRDFTVVGVLKGSCIFVSDLVRRIPVPLDLSFICAESYRNGTTPGELELRLLPHEHEIRGANLLLLDDILDSGRTLAALRVELLSRGALEVKIGVFLDKPARRSVEIEPDFRCFEVEDHFVVGFGLDHAGRYRNLPYVGALGREAQTEPEAARPR